jgi:anti-sigma factor RsiW
VSRLRDIDLMQHADGELSDEDERLLAEQLDADPEAAAKLAALEQVGETVRTYVELAGDRVESRFDAMWSSIEQRIESQARASETAVMPPRAVETPAPKRGLWASFAAWLDGYRGHVITGAISAGAVAMLILFLRPPHEVVRERTVAMPTPAPTPLDVMPANLPSTPPEVVELDVASGSGTVFTMADEDGEGGAVVLWVTSEETEEI